ncbi:MAG: hypothetical protein MZV63_07190 [Marinilabiliales bacterium]|nr:hypothetical protein [Marinilabiliales bacterium]
MSIPPLHWRWYAVCSVRSSTRNAWRRFSVSCAPGGIFGLGEPMHLDVPILADLSIYASGEEPDPKAGPNASPPSERRNPPAEPLGSTSSKPPTPPTPGTGGMSSATTTPTAKPTPKAKPTSNKMADAG